MEKARLDLLREVISFNRELQQRAREFNVRAGEEVFPVLTRQEWEERLRPLLAGAVSVATIPDIQKLRLPELDQELVGLVLRENPDTIEVLGKPCKVEYRAGQPPRVRIDFRGEAAMDWLNLPEEIRLPGGREVNLYSAVEGYGYYIDAPSREFKEKARECLNLAQWENWRQRPEIPVPPSLEDDLPEIAEAVYGACVVTGEPLKAFGTIAVNHNRYYSSDPWFKTQWFRTRAEAEAAFSQAKAKLEELRAEARERQAYEAAKALAEASRSELAELYKQYYYSSEVPLPAKLQLELYNRFHSPLPESSADLIRWKTETDAFIAEVEAAVEKIRRQKRRSGGLAPPNCCSACFGGFSPTVPCAG
jgi:hypothetical protein